jgi:hypothetical protein
MTGAIDDTPAGAQCVLAGAERIGTAALLQRRADAPLKPARPQVPCNVGLFDDDARNQGTLL